MSQAKVDKYKQEKATRQQTIKKEKRMHKIKVTVGSLVVLGLAGWIGVSVFSKVENRQLETVYFDVSALEDYVNELAEESDKESDEESDKETDKKAE